MSPEAQGLLIVPPRYRAGVAHQANVVTAADGDTSLLKPAVHLLAPVAGLAGGVDDVAGPAAEPKAEVEADDVRLGLGVVPMPPPIV